MEITKIIKLDDILLPYTKDFFTFSKYVISLSKHVSIVSLKVI